MALIRVGDDLVDEETGEYAGPADTTLPEALATESDLVAFMHRLSDAEARLQAKRMQLDAVIENCRKMLKREEDRVSWLRRKYEMDARSIAYSMLPRKKDGSFSAKTFTCPWGQVSFREVKPTIEILDEQAALSWAIENLPSAIRVKETVLVTPIKEQFIEGNDLKKPLPANCFGFVEGRQVATFTTVGKSKENKNEED